MVAALSQPSMLGRTVNRLRDCDNARRAPQVSLADDEPRGDQRARPRGISPRDSHSASPIRATIRIRATSAARCAISVRGRQSRASRIQLLSPRARRIHRRAGARERRTASIENEFYPPDPTPAESRSRSTRATRRWSCISRTTAIAATSTTSTRSGARAAITAPASISASVVEDGPVPQANRAGTRVRDSRCAGSGPRRARGPARTARNRVSPRRLPGLDRIDFEARVNEPLARPSYPRRSEHAGRRG